MAVELALRWPLSWIADVDNTIGPLFLGLLGCKAWTAETDLAWPRWSRSSRYNFISVEHLLLTLSTTPKRAVSAKLGLAAQQSTKCTVLQLCFSRSKRCRSGTGKPKSVRGDLLELPTQFGGSDPQHSGYRRDAYQFVSTCEKCQKSGMAISKRHEMPQQPILFCEGIDFMGPFPVFNGYAYILLVLDYVSRWVESIATKTNDSKVVVDLLKSNIFCRFGVPKALKSDQDSHFCNRVMSSLLHKNGEVHRIAIAYHP
ncbi:pol, partial [Mucuna pruriens]